MMTERPIRHFDQRELEIFGLEPARRVISKTFQFRILTGIGCDAVARRPTRRTIIPTSTSLHESDVLLEYSLAGGITQKDLDMAGK
jgi:hypothetical protein